MSQRTHSINIALTPIDSLSLPPPPYLSAFLLLCSPLGRLPVRLGAAIDRHVKTAPKPVTPLSLREQGLCESYYTCLCSTD